MLKMSHLRDYNRHVPTIICSFARNVADRATHEERHVTVFMLDVFLVVNFAGKLYANFLCDFACNIIAVERCLVAKPARIAET